MSLRHLGVRTSDLAFAAALAAVQMIGSSFAARGQPERADLDAAGFVLLALGPLALAVWRRHVLAALVGVVAVTLVYLLAEYPFGPFMLSVVAALVLSVVEGHRVFAWLGAVAIYGGHFAGMALLDHYPGVTPGALAGVATWFALVLTGAELARGALERRREAERAREEEARRRVDEERVRIARDLHDVLAHSISLINVQASSALHLIDERPEGARTALSVIKDASADALRDVRATLGLLRESDEAVPRSPAPSLRDLDALVASATNPGLEVGVEITGREGPLPAAVDQAAYRIVQEALTNVRRHADAGSATVRLIYGERELTVSVEDDGTGPPDHDAGAAGNGIVGMRDRAAALGGSVAAGPRPAGGFGVLARLPLDGTA